MPPKKKGKGKKGGKKADEGEVKKIVSEVQLDESSKAYYLVQIKDLENRLLRYQQKSDHLSIINNDLEEKYNQLIEDRRDIVEYLKKSLEERQEDLSGLQDRLVGQEQIKDAEKDNYEDKLVHLQDDFQDLKDRFTAEMIILNGKLDSLEEFRIHKDELMQGFADLTLKFEDQEKDHTEAVYKLERKAVVDKDRMKKEMAVHLSAVADEYRKVSDLQMADTVKRNIRENVSISIQLSKMSDTLKDMIRENDELRRREREYHIQIEILESTQEEFAKKNSSLTKVLKMLSKTTQGQRETLHLLEVKDEENQAANADAEVMKQENEAMKEQVKSLEDELQKTLDILGNVRADNYELSNSSERLEDILTSTAYTLKEVLTEKFDEDEEDLAIKRQTMIERLLLVLDTAALLGKAPPPKDFFKQRSKTIMGPLRPPTKTREETSRMRNRYPHYQLGDLGLVPRPSRKLDRRSASLPSSPAYTSRGLSTRGLPNSVSTTPRPKRNKLPPVG